MTTHRSGSSPKLPLILWNIRTAFGSALCRVRTHIYDLYLITIDDSPTFVIPNTVFGVAGSLAPSLIQHATAGALLLIPTNPNYTIIRTLTFNWTNLLIFDLANQRQAGIEDVHNKPWRPIPSGRMSTTEMRHWLMVALPVVLVYNHFILGVGTESSLLALLTWLYNDLGGGDDNWLVRNLIIACAFGLYNLGSLKVAVASSTARPVGGTFNGLTTLSYHTPLGPTSEVSRLAYIWTGLISAVIFTTMHVQDLKDVKGDAARGRRSAPIVLGRRTAGWTIAVPVVLWSGVCPLFWDAPLLVGLVPAVLGLWVAWRCVNTSEKLADRRTWQLWCAWTAALYLIPPLSS